MDLEDIVHAAQSALAVAEPARRAQIIDMAVGSLDGIAAEFDRLDAEARRRTEGDMRTVARYVETRYGSSDFSGEPAASPIRSDCAECLRPLQRCVR